MKSQEEIDQEMFEKEYNELMQEFNKQALPVVQQPQWVSPCDYIPQFSLYQEVPNGITSTDTCSTYNF